MKFSIKRIDARFVKLCFFGSGTTIGVGEDKFCLYSSSEDTDESVLLSSSELSSDFSSSGFGSEGVTGVGISSYFDSSITV